MTIYKTYCFKIKDPNQGKVEKLRKLAGLFRKGLNYCLEMAKQAKPKHTFDLHAHVYPFLRGIGLPSQFALACRDKAFEAYQSHQTLKELDPIRHRAPHFDAVPAIQLNIHRSCQLVYIADKDQYWASVTTLDGRINLRITGNKKTLESVLNSETTHAEIVFKGDTLYLHVAVPFEIEKSDVRDVKTFIGVDLNVFGHFIFAQARDITGYVIGCFSIPVGRLNWKRKHFNEVRRALQRKKNLKKVEALGHREQDYVTSFLHLATTRFIRWAQQFPEPFIALEDLSGIRKKVRFSKSLNQKIHSWPFGSGQAMFEYKGLLEGMFVRALASAFSSRYCSRCQSRNTRRSGALFACLGCGYRLNAHLNGAGNMAWRAIRYTQVAAGRAGRAPSVNPALKPSAVMGVGNS